MSDSKFDEIKSKVEAVLFSYADWLSDSEIKEALGIDSDKLILTSLKELRMKYKEGYPFQIENDDIRWRMVLREAYQDVVSELITGTEIPRNVLKVLSVIAYEQPVTKTRLSEILGKYVKTEVDYLYKAKFVVYEKVGVGKYYRVTKKFYDYFKMDKDDNFKSKADEKLSTFLMPSEVLDSENSEK